MMVGLMVIELWLIHPDSGQVFSTDLNTRLFTWCLLNQI